jgi:hypothetical protein
VKRERNGWQVLPEKTTAVPFAGDGEIQMKKSGQQNSTIYVLLGLPLLIGLPFFFLGGPGYHSLRSFQTAWDLGHILFFLLLSLWLKRFLLKSRAASSPYALFLTIFLLVFGAGFLVELLQMLSQDRSPDLYDLLRNQLGCLAAFAFFSRPAHGVGNWRLFLFRGGVLLLLAVGVWPLARSLLDESIAGSQFPVLADFETPFEQSRWVNIRQLQEETETVRHGKKAVRVQLSTNRFSGIALFYFPRDWSGYKTLHYSVYIPQEAGLLLNCRIHDTLHKQNGSEYADRFNQQFMLGQGWNDLVVSLEKVKNAPKGRAMDMEHIEGFGLFVVQQARPQEIYLDHVYLSK